MNPLYVVLFISIIGAVMSMVGSVLKKKRAGSEKYQKIIEDFQQQVNEMLEQDEAVEAVCGYNPCAAVTNKRLLISTKTGIDSVQFCQIKSMKGMTTSGNKTKNPDSMLTFTIKAEKKYVLGNESEGFERVVESLYRYVGA